MSSRLLYAASPGTFWDSCWGCRWYRLVYRTCLPFRPLNSSGFDWTYQPLYSKMLNLTCADVSDLLSSSLSFWQRLVNDQSWRYLVLRVSRNCYHLGIWACLSRHQFCQPFQFHRNHWFLNIKHSSLPLRWALSAPKTWEACLIRSSRYCSIMRFILSSLLNISDRLCSASFLCSFICPSTFFFTAAILLLNLDPKASSVFPTLLTSASANSWFPLIFLSQFRQPTYGYLGT